MADITTYLEDILTAIFGEEVRQSIHDAIYDINSDLQTTKDKIGTFPSNKTLTEYLDSVNIDLQATKNKIGTFPSNKTLTEYVDDVNTDLQATKNKIGTFPADKTVKQYVDDSVSRLYEPKGSATVTQINQLQSPEVGWVYNMLDSGRIGSGASAFDVLAGDNIVYIESGWDKFSGTIDLSPYAKNTDLNNLASVNASQHAEIIQKIVTDILTHDTSNLSHNDIRNKIDRIINYGDSTIEPTGQDKFTINYLSDHRAAIASVSDSNLNYINIPYEVINPENNEKYTVVTIANDAFNGLETVTRIIIPNSITTVGIRAFKNCINLEEIRMPNYLSTIPGELFSGCSSLKSVKIPNGPTVIDEEAFYHCYNIENIIIPDGVTEIHRHAFIKPESTPQLPIAKLKTVFLPKTLNHIYGEAFSGLPNNHVFYYEGTEEEWSLITKGSAWGGPTGTYFIYYNYDFTASTLGDLYLHDDDINAHANLRNNILNQTTTNLKNGSRIGSIRNVEAADEDQDYTIGRDAVSLGLASKASGDYSSADGWYTNAKSNFQKVIGKANEIDEDGRYVFIIGNGDNPTERNNAHTVDWGGNAWYSGDIRVGADKNKVSTEKYVDDSIDAIESDDIPFDNTASGLDATNVKDAIDEIAILGMGGNLRNWQQLRNIVRSGNASKYFDVGDQFEVMRGQTPLIFTVIGFDQDVPVTSTCVVNDGSGITNVNIDYFKFLKTTRKAGEFKFIFNDGSWTLDDFTINLSSYYISITGTPENGDSIEVSIPHTMTFRKLDVSDADGLIFDAQEALWRVRESEFPSGLTAGTYYFTLYGNTYNFTISRTVPIGGVIRYDSNGRIYAYHTQNRTSSSENVPVSSGQAGTPMPTNNMNSIDRNFYGNSCWKESSVRQWLNSDSNNWWSPQNDFDLPINTERVGFLNNIDSDFLSVVGAVYKKTYNNYGLEITEERFFLPSVEEVYGVINDSEPESIPYEYYGLGSSDLSQPGNDADTNRIIRNASTPKISWLRSRNNDYWVWVIGTDGSITTRVAVANYTSLAPACVIY